MLTVVLLLMLPVLLCLSALRLLQLPRDLRAHRARINPRRPLLSTLAFGVVYVALTAYTVLVLLAVARAFWTPSEAIHDLWAAATVGAG